VSTRKRASPATAPAPPDEPASIEALLAFVRGLLARRGFPPADRDDLVQDVALVLLLRWPSYSRERGTPRMWVRGIVAIECRRWAGRRRRVVGDLVRELPEVRVESKAAAIVAAQELLAQVPAAERRVIELFAAGYTLRDVAAREGISASTAQARLGRGLDLARSMGCER
jgi:RNA polymerase sigma factor (sigma-70 family)